LAFQLATSVIHSRHFICVIIIIRGLELTKMAKMAGFNWSLSRANPCERTGTHNAHNINNSTAHAHTKIRGERTIYKVRQGMPKWKKNNRAKSS